jgi:hypothetical protein
MDATSKKGIKNLEKTLKTEEVTKTKKEGTDTETIKSEMIRYENADSIYE